MDKIPIVKVFITKDGLQYFFGAVFVMLSIDMVQQV